MHATGFMYKKKISVSNPAVSCVSTYLGRVQEMEFLEVVNYGFLMVVFIHAEFKIAVGHPISAIFRPKLAISDNT